MSHDHLTATRRELLRGTLALAAGAALPLRVFAQAATAATPALFVSHGSPLLAADPIRGPELRTLGASLPKPRGILALTPHYRSRHFELGALGPGRAGYTFPRGLVRALPPNLQYPSPANDALAARVTDLLSGAYSLQKSQQRVLNHTTWMPLYHLFPSADVPVLELAHPYVSERELLTLGARLAPLRDEGVLIMSSGGATHNLAAFSPGAPAGGPVPAWAREFDAWLAKTLGHSDVDALIDYRERAPAVELAHPDDGDHYNVMLIALGAALGTRSSLRRCEAPIVGFEDGGMSKRCVVLD